MTATPIGHVLIVRPGALGDAVLTLPVLSALKAAGAESVTILCTPASWAFLPRDGNVRVLDFGSSEWMGLFADGVALSKAASDVFSKTRTAVVYLSGEKAEVRRRLIGHGVERLICIEPPVAGNDLQNHFPIGGKPRNDLKNRFPMTLERITERHAMRRLLDPLTAVVGAEVVRDVMARQFESSGWSFTSDEMQKWHGVFERDEAKKRGVFAMHPGSGGRRKCWPAASFAKLAARIWRETGLAPLVFFGPADDETHTEFLATIDVDVPWCAARNWPLREAMAAMAQCGFFAGNDSGMTHLAARVTPAVFAIFGPTDPDVWAPAGKRVEVVCAPDGDLVELSVDAVMEIIRASC